MGDDPCHSRLAGAVLATNLLRSGTTSPILFLYSVAFISVPVALYPVRGRLLKAVVAQQRNPDVTAKPDRLATAWTVGFVSVVILVAVIALMTTPYGMQSYR
ncbi:hypothetical protein [Actinoallomurus sp. NPDC052274]|uniref:hypothetical protein n=1 Tax=Actinoallomurus sp. NPDC052274 TaxID=3155420 RepID=UPI00342DD48C